MPMNMSLPIEVAVVVVIVPLLLAVSRQVQNGPCVVGVLHCLRRHALSYAHSRDWQALWWLRRRLLLQW